MPGFTHLQVAQPVSFGHHLMAYYEMLEARSHRASPIAARALQPVCRWAPRRLPARRSRSTAERVAQELGFDGVCENSLDAVSDRDFAIEFCAAPR